jgi:hypothetical protein
LNIQSAERCNTPDQMRVEHGLNLCRAFCQSNENNIAGLNFEVEYTKLIG